MKKIFLITCLSILITSFFLCCGTRKKLTNQPPSLSSYLVLDSLVCKKLSEDIKGLSSGDDEILLITQIRNNRKAIFNSNQGYTTFSKEYRNHKVGQRFSLEVVGSEASFVVILLEQDSNLEPYELSNIVDQTNIFSEFPKIDKVLLQEKLGDDDLLDTKVINLKKINNNKNTPIKLYGIHLFDEYEYLLYWHLE